MIRWSALSKFDAGSERKTKFAEMIVSQVGQNRFVDRIVQECRLKAFDTNAAQPFAEVHDGVPRTLARPPIVGIDVRSVRFFPMVGARHLFLTKRGVWSHRPRALITLHWCC
jgi:hypothetical protein